MSLGPEALFRVYYLAHDGVVTRAMMGTGPWMSGPSGLPCAGSLGVLVDNALGYAMIAELPNSYWSVSAEISIELCAAIPIAGSLLRAEASLLQTDTFGAWLRRGFSMRLGESSRCVANVVGSSDMARPRCRRPHGMWAMIPS